MNGLLRGSFLWGKNRHEPPRACDPSHVRGDSPHKLSTAMEQQKAQSIESQSNLCRMYPIASGPFPGSVHPKNLETLPECCSNPNAVAGEIRVKTNKFDS